MDYTGFVRYYITSALKKLEQYKHYYGILIDITDLPNVSMSNFHEVTKPIDLTIYPSFVPNINASIEVYEEFSQWMGCICPDLVVLFLDAQNLRELYRIVSVDKNDELVKSIIDTTTDTVFKFLEQSNTLVK